MDEAKRSQRLIIVLVTMMLSISVSTALQVFVLQQDTPVYHAAGALVAASPKLQDVSAKIPKSLIDDCFGGVIEKLESDEIQRRAMSSVLAAYPRLLTCPVKIEALRIKSSTVIHVGALGGQPDYVTAFLDALMDEFVAFSTTADDPVTGKLGAFTILEKASVPVRVLDDWQEPAISGVITGGLAGLLAGLMLAFFFVRPEEVQIGPASATASHTGQDVSHSRYFASYRHLIWGATAGTVLGLSVQLILLASQPPCFRSLAKVVALKETAHGPIPGSPGYAEYYGKIIRELESPELALKAMRRTHTIYPEIKVRDVDIRVAQTKGSAVFNVLATGDDPKYTRYFLDALLDEFSFSRLNRTQETGQPAEHDAIVQERAIPAVEEVPEWTMPLLTGALVGTLAGGMLGMLFQWLSRRRQKALCSADIAF